MNKVLKLGNTSQLIFPPINNYKHNEILAVITKLNFNMAYDMLLTSRYKFEKDSLILIQINNLCIEKRLLGMYSRCSSESEDDDRTMSQCTEWTVLILHTPYILNKGTSVI